MMMHIKYKLFEHLITSGVEGCSDIRDCWQGPILLQLQLPQLVLTNCEQLCTGPSDFSTVVDSEANSTLRVIAPRSTSWHTKRGSPSRVAEQITKTKVYICEKLEKLEKIRKH